MAASSAYRAGTFLPESTLSFAFLFERSQRPTRFYPGVLSELRGVAGVASATGAFDTTAMVLHAGAERTVSAELIETDYCATLGPKMLLGNCLGDDLIESESALVMVSESLMHSLNIAPNAALGTLVSVGKERFQIYGVVDSRFSGLGINGAAQIWLSSKQFSKVIPTGIYIERSPGLMIAMRHPSQNARDKVLASARSLGATLRSAGLLGERQTIGLLPGHVAIDQDQLRAQLLQKRARTLVWSAALVALLMMWFSAGFESIRASWRTQIEINLGLSTRQLALRNLRSAAELAALALTGVCTTLWLFGQALSAQPVALALLLLGLGIYLFSFIRVRVRSQDRALLNYLARAVSAMGMLVLVIAQAAMAMMLEYASIYQENHGFSFQNTHVASFARAANDSRFARISAQRSRALVADVEAWAEAKKLRVGISDTVPFFPAPSLASGKLTIAGQALEMDWIYANGVFLTHMGATLVGGRMPRAQDQRELVLSVDAVAEFGDTPAGVLGKLVSYTSPVGLEKSATIVGVVTAFRLDPSRESSTTFAVSAAELGYSNGVGLTFENSAPSASMIKELEALANLHYPGLKITRTAAFQEMIEEHFQIERTLLLYAAAATMLLLICVVSFLAHLVQSLIELRKKEFGTLLAIGASPNRALWQISESLVKGSLPWILISIPIAAWLQMHQVSDIKLIARLCAGWLSLPFVIGVLFISGFIISRHFGARFSAAELLKGGGV